jgi:poly(3-hydroxybutyrate) depolymerase
MNPQEIQNADDKSQWYHLSAETWLLIGGLILLSVGCFFNPNIIDTILRFSDYRFWSWWYFVILLLIVLFSIKRYLSAQSRDIFDSEIVEVGKRFLRTKTFYRCLFYCFWTVAAVIVILRIVFDMTTYLSGSTIAVQATQSDDYQYLLHLPPGYTDFGNPRPLIVFLHGAGETNQGLDSLKRHDLWYFAKGHIEARDFPYIVVSPMTSEHGWEPLRVKNFIEQIVNDHSRRYRIDPQRVYLTGYSMGGFGTFHTACVYPEMFAAIAPVAGGGEPKWAENLKTVPTWAFHGDKDEVVSYESSANMIDAMIAVGHNDARLTSLNGVGHGIAGEVYRSPKLYRWMLTHRKQ